MSLNGRIQDARVNQWAREPIKQTDDQMFTQIIQTIPELRRKKNQTIT